MKRALLLLLAVPLILAVLLLAGAETLLNTTAARTRIEAALQRATGHPARLEGRLSLAWSLTPGLVLRDAALLNAPGFSRPALATLRRLEGRVGLLPLLSGRIEVPDVMLEGADILLERDAAGRGNWQPAEAAAPAPAAPSAARPRAAVTVGRILLQDSRLAWSGAPPLEVQRLALSPAGGPVEGALTFRGAAIALAGRTGPIDRAPVPLDLTAVGGGLALSLAGEAGGALALQLLAPDLAALEPWAGRPLPPVKNIAASVQLDRAGPAALRLTAGAAELGGGLRLVRLEASAAGPDQPLTLAGEAAVLDLPIGLSLNLGSVQAMARGGPLPFQFLALADGASFAAQGAFDPATAALDATISAAAPDLRRTGARAGLVLPAMHDAALTLRLLPAPGGAGALARGLRLSMAEGDLAGDLAFGTQPRPSLRGSLQAQRLDLDALLAPGSPLPPPPPGAAPVPAPAPGAGPLVPPTPLPFAQLRRFDLDLRLAAAQLAWRRAAYRAAEARLYLQEGRLRLDPAQAQGPGGPIMARLAADATATPPTASLTLRAEALEAAALTGTDLLGGPLDVDIELAGAGADLRSLALSAQGRAGLALVDGEVENQALVAMLGPVLRAAGLPAEAQGRSRLRCLALRIDAAGAIVRVATLALDSTRLRLEGEGAVNLVDDTLDMHLRPTLRLGPTGVAIPVRLTGPVRAPRPELERGAIAPGRLGISILPGRIGLGLGGAGADICPPALAAARDNRPGRLP